MTENHNTLLLVMLLTLLGTAVAETVPIQSPTNNQPTPPTVTEPVKFTIFPSDFEMSTKGTPWLTL